MTGGAPALPERARFVQLGVAAASQVPVFDAVGPVLPLLAGAAAGHGAIYFVPDGDGVVRRLPLLARVGDRLPNLATTMRDIAASPEIGADWDHRSFMLDRVLDGISRLAPPSD